MEYIFLSGNGLPRRPLSAYLYDFDLLIGDSQALHTQTIESRRERLSELLPESIDPILVAAAAGVRRARL